MELQFDWIEVKKSKFMFDACVLAAICIKPTSRLGLVCWRVLTSWMPIDRSTETNYHRIGRRRDSSCDLITQFAQVIN